MKPKQRLIGGIKLGIVHRVAICIILALLISVGCTRRSAAGKWTLDLSQLPLPMPAAIHYDNVPDLILHEDGSFDLLSRDSGKWQQKDNVIALTPNKPSRYLSEVEFGSDRASVQPWLGSLDTAGYLRMKTCLSGKDLVFKRVP